MEEENQQPVKQGPPGPVVPIEPQQAQQVMKEPQRVTTKDPKKVEAGKRPAAINRKKREAKKREEQAQLEKTTSRVNQYYGIGAILALGVIGGLGYCIYWSKKGGATTGWGIASGEQPWGRGGTPGPEGPSNPQRNDPLKTKKLEMD